jgi:hypothetical protein
MAGQERTGSAEFGQDVFIGHEAFVAPGGIARKGGWGECGQGAVALGMEHALR